MPERAFPVPDPRNRAGVGEDVLGDAVERGVDAQRERVGGWLPERDVGVCTMRTSSTVPAGGCVQFRAGEMFARSPSTCESGYLPVNLATVGLGLRSAGGVVRAARPAVEELDDLGAGRGLAELGEDAFEAVPVGVGVVVGHRVRGKHDVVAVVVGGACGGLDAGTGGDAGEHDLGDAEVAQQGVEAGVVEGAAAPLGDQVVARLPLELVDDVRPARGQRAGAAGRAALPGRRRSDRLDDT